jgi:uncharacterized protein Yka (UPF0111/DUF47 family)
MGFISTFMLPKNVDFNAALRAQTCTARVIVESLQKVCVDNDATALATLSTTFDKARVLKTKNMKELLDVFITPYDKESIYRIITQLDWIALSAKHFLLEFEAYGALPIREYQPIFQALVEMIDLLEQGVDRLSKKSARAIAHNIDHIYEKYDQVVAMSTESMAELLKQDDFKRIIMHRELLAQLKEVAKRIQVTANSLEDMAIKVT